MTALIKEAYIDPIRSVIVVDDEYPTLEKLLPSGEKGDGYPEEVKELLGGAITLCRNPENNWMLDVHDGDFNEASGASNLHHSDLLILDYHLEKGNEDGKGEKALQVLSSLAEKDHFNLVVVHTKGYSEFNGSDSHRAVFKDVVLELQQHEPFSDVPEKMASKIESAINQWMDEIDDGLLLDDLINSITDIDYLKLRKVFRRPMEVDSDRPELLSLFAKFQNKPSIEGPLESLDFRCLVWYVLVEKGKLLKGQFGQTSYDGFDWDESDGQFNWVKTENLFVTVVSKDIDTQELPDKLTEALINWDPHPNRLLLAKLRHQLDEKGFSVANSLMNRQHVQAGWLKELLSCEDALLEQQAWACIQNHMEEVSYSLKFELCGYLCKLVEPLKSKIEAHKTKLRLLPDNSLENKDSEQQKEVKKRIKEAALNHVLPKYAPIKVLNDHWLMFKEVNAFHNSIAIEGKHLVTGHVLKSELDELFLVVTPACDLVPGRGGHNRLEVCLQRLYPLGEALQREGEKKLKADEVFKRSKDIVNSKKLMFLNVDGDVVVLSSLFKVYGNSTPTITTIVVEDDGVWGDGNMVSAYASDLSTKPPSYSECSYTVVAQLRYEYALHHSKVSGEHQSRIGLDYF